MSLWDCLSLGLRHYPVGLSAHVMALDIRLAPTGPFEFDLQTPAAWTALGNALGHKSEAVACGIHIDHKTKIIIPKTINDLSDILLIASLLTETFNNK